MYKRQTYNYTYDTASRITAIDEIDGTVAYSYDDRDQLTGANYTDPTRTDEFYQYDANGNRVASYLHGTGYRTGPANRLLSDGTYNYEYDNEGNTIRRTEIATGAYREFQWDHRNRLVAVIDRDVAGAESQVVKVAYDVLGRRILKSVDAAPADAVGEVATWYIYDRKDVLMDVVVSNDEGTSSNARFLHGPWVDELLATDDGRPTAEWALLDQLGSVRALLDGSLGQVSELDFSSYDAQPDPNPRYLFTGRENEAGLGMYYYSMRFYDGFSGRFLSEDPIRHAGGSVSYYAYVANSPTNYVDPFDLKPSPGESAARGAASDYAKHQDAGSAAAQGSLAYMKRWAYEAIDSVGGIAKTIKEKFRFLKPLWGDVIGMTKLVDNWPKICESLNPNTDWKRRQELWMQLFEAYTPFTRNDLPSLPLVVTDAINRLFDFLYK